VTLLSCILELSVFTGTLTILRFLVIFLSSSKIISGCYLKLHHGCFLLCPSPVHHHAFIYRCLLVFHSINYTYNILSLIEYTLSFNTTSLIVAQLVQFLALWGTQRFITIFTRSCFWPLFWSRWAHFTPSHHVYFGPILILCCHHCLTLPSGLSFRFPHQEPVCISLLFHDTTSPTYPISLDLIFVVMFVEEYKLWISQLPCALSSVHPLWFRHSPWYSEKT